MRKIVPHLAQLSEIRFVHLGNLYNTTDHKRCTPADTEEPVLLNHRHSGLKEFSLGKLVDQSFFLG